MKGMEVEKAHETNVSQERSRNRWEPVLVPRTDIRESGDHFEIEVEMPGVSADAVALEVEGDELRIGGRRADAPADDSAPEPMYLVRERRTGTYHRIFRLGSQVDHEAIEGKMTDGVLRIRLQKHKSALPRRIQIAT